MSSKCLIYFCDKIIDTTITHEASIADAWVNDILKSMPLCSRKIINIGLNCKWKPHPIKSMSRRIATLQLCFDTKCLILQLLYMDVIPQSIKNFLSNPNVVFVGIETEETSLKLRNEYGLCCNKKIDVSYLAKISFPLSFHGKPGLKALAHQLAQLPSWKPKSTCLHDVESRVLSEEQIKCACIDAYASYRIGSKLLPGMQCFV